MTQELINKYFRSELGEQCISLFSTSDNQVFIRKSEAEFHLENNQLDDYTIMEWYDTNDDYEPIEGDYVPEDRYPE